MAKRRKGYGSISIKTCPREGMRVVVNANSTSRRLYSGGIPPNGTVGTVQKMNLGSRRSTCLRGPGGGLVYVKFASGLFTGISSIDLDKAR